VWIQSNCVFINNISIICIIMSRVSSRRNSSILVSSDQPPSSTPRGSVCYTKCSRKINPVRRCQSMRSPDYINGYAISCKLQNRRVSSTPSSLEDGKGLNENNFVKYYQYKINKPNPVSDFDIVIVDYTDDYNSNSKCSCCTTVPLFIIMTLNLCFSKRVQGVGTWRV